jgi:hypothetical protein
MSLNLKVESFDERDQTLHLFIYRKRPKIRSFSVAVKLSIIRMWKILEYTRSQINEQESQSVIRHYRQNQTVSLRKPIVLDKTWQISSQLGNEAGGQEEFSI